VLSVLRDQHQVGAVLQNVLDRAPPVNPHDAEVSPYQGPVVLVHDDHGPVATLEEVQARYDEMKAKGETPRAVALEQIERGLSIRE